MLSTASKQNPLSPNPYSGPLAVLLGPQAAHVLGAAIGAHAAHVQSLRLGDVRVQANGAVRARYRVHVGCADGSGRSEALVAVAGATVPAGAAVVAGECEGRPMRFGVWRWPQDPALPALQTAANTTAVAEWLTDHGLPIAANPILAVRAYRPAQRAVLELGDNRHRYFVKVVRPEAVPDLVARQRLLSAQLPVPPVLAESADGMVVLPAATGSLLRDIVVSGQRAEFPAPVDVESVLDELPAALLQFAGHRSVLQRVSDSVEVLRICARDDPAVPASVAAGLVTAADRIAAAASSAPPVPHLPVPVHGDFHHAQLLVRGRRISALLDVDTAGPGDRADEWATLIGHLSVLGMNHVPARDYCSTMYAHAERRVDGLDLRRRTAAVILGMATGPFRNRLPDWHTHTAGRLELAQCWLAGRVR